MFCTMSHKVAPIRTGLPSFGKNSPRFPLKSPWIRALLLSGASLFMSHSATAPAAMDAFVKAPEAIPSPQDSRGSTRQFDQLVETFYEEWPQTKPEFSRFRQKLETIDPSLLDQRYQGLYMLFDRHLEKELFYLEEGGALNRLGIEEASRRMDFFRKAFPISREHLVYPEPRSELKSGGVGKHLYDALLKLENFVDLDSEGLIQLAKAQYEAIEAEMNQLAVKINPAAKSWREVYLELGKHQPKPKDLLKVYRSEIERTRSFLQKQDLVDIPPETLKVKETPAFLRDSLPYAGYMIGAGTTGTFLVTTLLDNDPQKREEQMRAHSYWFIPPVVVHEAFPGHHLQHVHDALADIDRKSPGGKTFQRILDLAGRNSFFTEGWGLYCEAMVRENGYYTRSEEDLGALRNMLWRAARAWIDPQIHTGRMNYEQAVDFLVDNILLDRDRAKIEVNRYYQRPGEVPSYLIGNLQIQQLRKQVKESGNKGAFSLKDFHNALLRGKELPVPVLAKMQFNQNLESLLIPISRIKDRL